MEKFRYFKINNNKYSVERIADDFTEVVVFKGEAFWGSLCFEGANAQEEALNWVLTSAEITEEEYNRE